MWSNKLIEDLEECALDLRVQGWSDLVYGDLYDRYGRCPPAWEENAEAMIATATLMATLLALLLTPPPVKIDAYALRLWADWARNVIPLSRVR